MKLDLLASTHLLAVAGSRAYGMHRPGSDVDLKGLAIPPAPFVLGLGKGFEVEDTASAMDVFLPLLTDEEREVSRTTKLEGSVFELRKLLGLALDCNPHVLDVLFCRDEEVRLATPIGREIREARQLVLSQRARYTFGGYATSQLKRIQTHRRWLLDPPKARPARADFGLPDTPAIPRDHLLAAEAAVKKQLEVWEPDFSNLDPSEALRVRDLLATSIAELRLADEERYRRAARWVGLGDNLVGVMLNERAYKAAVSHHDQ
ncbi:MAG: nucleotidyltransferase domain-containing protein, partial [Myxococcales bacterium]|nr:nucleotidyltransferase domain-containing protein [Myxococcales bacterium]